jgi:hypothetical protein
MTDKEMALALGDRFLQLHKRVTAMEAILSNVVLNDGTRLDWRPMLAFDEVALESNKIYRDGSDLLRASVAEATPNLPLIQVLYRLFV